ncbi:predicted protein [Lichtheimia corymbifera JMRC:FSU:9682]|uniref:Uncharacterized protein n=1 Tax=Lichtheimia corymbifera JMRC:FSU:9682 TaxID=1263082 RepID=A0A068SDP6_9FUNG|nr:predicted protein [Lichtheimia corymbifera JMRC:FSU:9682]
MLFWSFGTSSARKRMDHMTWIYAAEDGDGLDGIAGKDDIFDKGGSQPWMILDYWREIMQHLVWNPG